MYCNVTVCVQNQLTDWHKQEKGEARTVLWFQHLCYYYYYLNIKLRKICTHEPYEMRKRHKKNTKMLGRRFEKSFVISFILWSRCELLSGAMPWCMRFNSSLFTSSVFAMRGGERRVYGWKFAIHCSCTCASNTPPHAEESGRKKKIKTNTKSTVEYFKIELIFISLMLNVPRSQCTDFSFSSI